MAESVKYWEVEKPVEVEISKTLTLRMFVGAQVLQILKWSPRFERPSQIFAIHLDKLEVSEVRQFGETINKMCESQALLVEGATKTSEISGHEGEKNDAKG